MCRTTLPEGNGEGRNNKRGGNVSCNKAKNKKIVATKVGAVITKPKRPLTAYNMFFKSERAKLLGIPPSAMYPASDAKEKRKHRKTHGKIGFIPLTRHISSRWKTLDKATKSSFHETYKKNRISYLEQLQRYKQAVEAAKKVPTATVKDPYAASSSPSHVPEIIISTVNKQTSFAHIQKNVDGGDGFSKKVFRRSFRSVFPTLKNEGASVGAKDAMPARTTSLILRERMQRMLKKIKVERVDEMVEPLVDISAIKNISSLECHRFASKRISVETSKRKGGVVESLADASALQSNDTLCREASFEAVEAMTTIETCQQESDQPCFNLSSATITDEENEPLCEQSQETVETIPSFAPTEITSCQDDPLNDALFSDEDVGLLLDMLIQ